jgi:hypothetical protein
MSSGDSQNMSSGKIFQSRRTLQSSQALGTSHKYLKSSASLAGSRFNMSRSSSTSNSVSASTNRLSAPKSRESSLNKRRPSISMSSVHSDSPRGRGTRNSRRTLDGFHSIVEYQIKMQRAQKKRVNAILRKGKIFRTEEDIGFLANHFKEFKAFVNVSEFLMHQLCAIMIVTEYDSGTAGRYFLIFSIFSG